MHKLQKKPGQWKKGKKIKVDRKKDKRSKSMERKNTKRSKSRKEG